MDYVQTIGWLSSACFMLCALPQVFVSKKQGHSEGVSLLFLLLWLAGEILIVYYVYMMYGWDWPQHTHYLVNIFFISIILKYKIKPRI